MSSYLNAYEMLSQVRYGINEHSTGYVQGTDTTGVFKNDELMRHINNGQYHIWSILFEQFPEYFLKSALLEFTNSEATLPSDCFKVREILDSNDCPVTPIKLEQKHTTGEGSPNAYYRYGNTIRLDSDAVTGTGTLWYYSRCRELDMGMTSAGGALSVTLPTTAKKIADYYNGMTIEDITGDAVDTISDYTAARVATVANTWAASRYYGLISELPAIFHPLIPEYALLQVKKSPKCPLSVTVADVSLFDQMLRSAMKSFAGTQNTDEAIGAMIEDFSLGGF